MTPLEEGKKVSRLELAKWQEEQDQQRALSEAADSLSDEISNRIDDPDNEGKYGLLPAAIRQAFPRVSPPTGEEIRQILSKPHGTPLASAPRQPMPGTWQMGDAMPKIALPPASDTWRGVQQLGDAISEHGRKLFPGYPGQIDGTVTNRKGSLVWGESNLYWQHVQFNGQLLNGLRSSGLITDAEAQHQINATLLHEVIHQAQNAVMAEMYKKDTLRESPWSMAAPTGKQVQDFGKWLSVLNGTIFHITNHDHPDLLRYSRSSYLGGRSKLGGKTLPETNQLAELMRQFVEMSLTGSISEEGPLSKRFKNSKFPTDGFDSFIAKDLAPNFTADLAPLHRVLRYLSRIVAKLKEWLGKSPPPEMADIVAAMEKQVRTWQKQPNARALPVADKYGQYMLPLASAPRRARQSMEFQPPFRTSFGDILTYHWMSKGLTGTDMRVSDWDKSRTNAQTGRDIVHHFKVRRSDGSIHTVSLESALGQLSDEQRSRLNKTIRSIQKQMALPAEEQLGLDTEAARTPVDNSRDLTIYRKLTEASTIKPLRPDQSQMLERAERNLGQTFLGFAAEPSTANLSLEPEVTRTHDLTRTPTTEQLRLFASNRTPAQTIEATGLAPAISVDGKPYTGRPGMTHGEILGDYVWRKVFTPQQRRDDPNQDTAVNFAHDPWIDSPGSGFDDFGFLDTRTAKFLTREEAYSLLTERGFTPPEGSYSIRYQSLDSIELLNSTRTGPLSAADRILAAAARTNTNPTDPQKDAENYETGKVTVQGLRLSIENPAGSVRKGTDANGKAWSIDMPHHYGRILGTTGADKDHVDFFLGPDHTSPTAFVINQKKPGNGHFDEHKIMLGFTNAGAAARGYLDSYTKGWRGYSSIVPMTIPQLKHWLENGNMADPVTKAPVVSNDTKPLASSPRGDFALDKPESAERVKAAYKYWDQLRGTRDSVFLLGPTPTSSDINVIAKAYSTEESPITVKHKGKVKKSDAAETWEIHTPTGIAYLERLGRQLYLNSSDVSGPDMTSGVKGAGGTQAYQIAMTFAHNQVDAKGQPAPMEFIPDPRDVSVLARIRRVSQMFSSALRHRTTSHLFPQLILRQSNDPDAAKLRGKFEIPGWKEGDTEGNIGRLALMEMKLVSEHYPEINQWQIDPKRAIFTHGNGTAVTRNFIESIIAKLDPGNTGTGETTLLRAVHTRRAVSDNTTSGSVGLPTPLEGLHPRGTSTDLSPLRDPEVRILYAAPRQISDQISSASFNHLDRKLHSALARMVERVTATDSVTAATQAIAAWYGKDAPTSNVVRSLKEFAQRELIPETVLPREIMSALHQMQIKQSMGQQQALDVGRALSGNPKFSDLALDSDNPAQRRPNRGGMQGDLEGHSRSGLNGPLQHMINALASFWN
jgi:hypothetical protein